MNQEMSVVNRITFPWNKLALLPRGGGVREWDASVFR